MDVILEYGMLETSVGQAHWKQQQANS